MLDQKKIDKLTSAIQRLGTRSELGVSRLDLADAVPDLLAEREEMLALLRKIEWNGMGQHGDCPACPSCGEDQRKGHAPDCRLAAFIPAEG